MITKNNLNDSKLNVNFWTKEKLREIFELDEHTSWKNEQGKPNIDYVNWLEENLVTIMKIHAIKLENNLERLS